MRYIKSIKTTHTLECTGDQLLNEVHGRGELELPEEVDKIEVKIPGGGDWSNTTLNFLEADIIVTWEDEHEEVEEFD